MHDVLTLFFFLLLFLFFHYFRWMVYIFFWFSFKRFSPFAQTGIDPIQEEGFQVVGTKTVYGHPFSSSRYSRDQQGQTAGIICERTHQREIILVLFLVFSPVTIAFFTFDGRNRYSSSSRFPTPSFSFIFGAHDDDTS
ncbi:MAG: hypothetical protein ACI8RD_002094 [Bacillariaceae sp.]|jgi:hypothetical protein